MPRHPLLATTTTTTYSNRRKLHSRLRLYIRLQIPQRSHVERDPGLEMTETCVQQRFECSDVTDEAGRGCDLRLVRQNEEKERSRAELKPVSARQPVLEKVEHVHDCRKREHQERFFQMCRPDLCQTPEEVHGWREPEEKHRRSFLGLPGPHRLRCLRFDLLCNRQINGFQQPFSILDRLDGRARPDIRVCHSSSRSASSSKNSCSSVRFHTRIDRSCDPVTSMSPNRDSADAQISPWCPRRIWMHSYVSASQYLIVPSLEVENR